MLNPIMVLLLSPAVIGPVSTGLISLIKRTPAVSNVEDQSKRNLILRGIAAVLSLGGIFGAFIATGIVPDVSQVSDILITIALVVMSLLNSLGFHNLFKR